MTVAALFVQSAGCYFGLPGVDPWDEPRDARLYAGPHPVVAHPPCQRWGKLWAGQPLHIKRTGIRKIKGDDAGCFAAALNAVRTFGGVLEHPWGSHAWPHFGLNTPPREGGWIAADFHGGWTCCVEQGRYGHYARKPTLLLAYDTDLPDLDFGVGEPRLDPAVVERMGLPRAKRLGEVGARGGGKDSAPRIGTPEPFRDLLLGIARTAGRRRGAGSGRSPAERRRQPQRPRHPGMIHLIKTLLTPRNPARDLALIGVEKRRQSVVERARQIRREIGLPDDPRLAG